MNRQIWNSQNGAASTIPAMKAILSRIRAPPKTSVTSSAQSPVLEPVPSARLSAGIEQYGARMNTPRPWSYHQKQNAVATRTTSNATATRLRNSRRCAIRLIVAAGSRGARRRPALTAAPPGNGSGGGVGDGGGGGTRPRPRLGSPDLGGARLGLPLGGPRVDDLAGHDRRRRGVRVVLHA